MAEAMSAVGAELRDQQRERELNNPRHRHRPESAPEGAAQSRGSLEEKAEEERLTGERDQRAARHVKSVVAHRARPSRRLSHQRPPELEKRDRDPHDDHDDRHHEASLDTKRGAQGHR